MTGRVFAVVGPSGAGKDTLMTEVAARHAGVDLVRRVISRPSESGGEDFEGVSPPEFARRKAAGAFALDWQAHGLSYGIPHGIDQAVAEGRVVLFNGSRTVVRQAWNAYLDLDVIHVTAPISVLAERLAQRGREDPQLVAARLARATYEVPDGPPIYTVCNDGALEKAIEAFLAILGAKL